MFYHFSTNKSKFKIRIKDPAFLHDYKPSHSIYFGRVYVQALIPCNDNKAIKLNNQPLCAKDQTKSEVNDLGVKNNEKIDTSHFDWSKQKNNLHNCLP